jgi:ribonuclease P protein component
VPAQPTLSRACFVASTNAVGGAVRRNRAKRRLREMFRHQQQHAPAGCDLLVIARAAALDWPLPELEKKFVEACELMNSANRAKAETR